MHLQFIAENLGHVRVIVPYSFRLYHFRKDVQGLLGMDSGYCIVLCLSCHDFNFSSSSPNKADSLGLLTDLSQGL